ncbi:hypothetical protein BRAS3843_2220011 [Bradyrhizobium sp. STM 3843]|nr:hypothetical protein BRAS3843_2220011 [Bradyrhizobium sp. STM 3843]
MLTRATRRRESIWFPGTSIRILRKRGSLTKHRSGGADRRDELFFRSNCATSIVDLLTRSTQAAPKPPAFHLSSLLSDAGKDGFAHLLTAAVRHGGEARFACDICHNDSFIIVSQSALTAPWHGRSITCVNAAGAAAQATAAAS